MNLILGILLGISITFNILYVISFKDIVKRSAEAVKEHKERLNKEYKKYGRD